MVGAVLVKGRWCTVKVWMAMGERSVGCGWKGMEVYGEMVWNAAILGESAAYSLINAASLWKSAAISIAFIQRWTAIGYRNKEFSTMERIRKISNGRRCTVYDLGLKVHHTICVPLRKGYNFWKISCFYKSQKCVSANVYRGFIKTGLQKME